MNGNTQMDDRRRRGELRAAVLRLGALLGWSTQEVIAFTEAVTNRRWRQCGCAEFETVLEEYWAIGRVIQKKWVRRRATRNGMNREGDHHVAIR